MKTYESDENLKTLYCCTKRNPFFVSVPRMNYITFDGTGHPAQEDFQIACEAVFTLSYIIKFEIARKMLNTDYKVNPMEVTWYLDKSTPDISFTWTMMIMQPPFITEDNITRAVSIAQSKKSDIAADRIKFLTLGGGRCVQAFHKGDYNRMNDTLENMIAFAKSHNLNYDQYTHDIYLNDSRRTKTENLKAIMRIGVYDSCIKAETDLR